MSESVVRVITYKGEDKDNFSVFVAKFKSDKPKSNKIFKLQGRVDMVNSQLSIVNQNLPEEDQVWLDASDLNLKVPDVKIVDSDIQATVNQLSFKGKRHKENYIVNELSGQVHYSETELSFKDLTLESDTSLLFGSLYFKHTKENGLSNFADKVNWDLDLKQGSKVSGKDLRYFVKTWNTNAVMELSGKGKGPLNNLALSQPVFSVNQTFYTASNLQLKDLISAGQPRSFLINTKGARLQTSYSSLKSWLPGFIFTKIPELVSNFGTANYQGEFSIDKKEIITKGNLISSVGSVQADAKLTDYSSKNPRYAGWVETRNLNIAPFTHSTVIGPITSKIIFDGSGFKPDQMNTRFDAKLAQLEFNGKVINSISAVGSLENRIFKGKINTDDVHTQLDFQGNVDFSQKVMKTNFEADIKNLDMGYFVSGIDKDTHFKGIVKSDIQFSTIDDLIGEINVSNILLTKNGKETAYNDIQIKTTSEEGNRNLDIFSPNMITANIYGKYKLNDIPAMLQEGVGNLLVNYKPKKRFDNQEFSFILDVQKDLFDLLMMDVTISPGTTITGSYIGKGNQLHSQIISQYIYYKNIKLLNPNVFLNTADSLRQFMGSLSSLEIDKTKIDNIDFSGFKRNDSLFASTNFYYGKYKGRQTHFDLNLYQTRIGNDLIFGFRPSDIDMLQGKWTLNPDFKSDEAIAKYNVITNKLTLEKTVAKSEKSEIVLSGEYTSKDNYNFDLNLTEVELGKIISKNLLKDISFEGIANGSAKIVKTAKDFKPLVNVEVEGLKFNNQILGNLSVNATYDTGEDKYLVDTKLSDSGEERFLAQGYIKNIPGSPAQVNVGLTANRMNIAPIGTFLQGIFSKFRGEATGNVQITGDLTNPKYEGMLAMDKVGFTVNFLGVDYELTKEQDLQISDGTFIFDNMELRDTKDGTLGTVAGFLQTKNFKEWGLNLDCSTERLLVLNTSEVENELFYGKIWASGTFSINGSTVKGIEISATAKALEGSKLTINSGSTANASDMSFIKFIPEQHLEDEDKPDVKPPTGLTIRANVTADSRSVVDLIISPETGDKIEVRGDTRNLIFEMSSAGKITMLGTYTITGDSKYYYNIFVNKDFKIETGSTIVWDGRGPTDAALDIKANYVTGVSNIGDYLGISAIPTTNVTVKADLKGYLSKPSITFDIAADVSTSVQDQLNRKLKDNEGEKYNQVAGIVMFSSFLSDKMGGSSYATSIYNVVLKQLTSVINNISSNFFLLDANYTAGSRVDNVSDRISLDPTFKLNPRLSIVGSINMPLEQKSAADVWTYGAKINYDISKAGDKTLIASGFSKPSTFGLDNSLLANSGADNQAYGGGLIYKKSFNKFSEIFGKKKKEENKEEKKENDSAAVIKIEESR